MSGDRWTTFKVVRRFSRPEQAQRRSGNAALGDKSDCRIGVAALLVPAYILLANLCVSAPMAQDESAVREVRILSTADQTLQPSKIFIPKRNSTEPIPLLVVLHSWSSDYKQKDPYGPCLAECQKRNWAMIHPNFRGPNVRPEACGSDLAVQDVLDAVEFAKKQTRIDLARIYLVGASGGGHMSLLMAGRAPKVWAGVSAWVPISDVAEWHAERTVRGGNKDKYRAHMQQVCGGAPGSSAAVDRQYRQRSPLTFLEKAVDIPIDINTGIHDGHTGSVPIGQSLNAFNLLARSAGQADKTVSNQQIQFMTSERKISKELANEAVKEEGRIRPVIFRRQAENARITIFEGSHEGDMPTAIRWLAKQRKVNQ